MVKYVCSIGENQNGEGHWIWEPGSAVPKTNERGAPIFKNGDKIKVKKQHCTGMHHIELRPAFPPQAILPSANGDLIFPFADPFHTSAFDYDPDTGYLTVVGDPDTTHYTTWHLGIGPVGGKSIDPEFQVGPGGVSTHD